MVSSASALRKVIYKVKSSSFKSLILCSILSANALLRSDNELLATPFLYIDAVCSLLSEILTFILVVTIGYPALNSQARTSLTSTPPSINP